MEALAAIPPGQAKTDGQAVGLQAANDIIAFRNGDGRMTPIAVSTGFPTLPPGPGVWRLTPPFAPPQVPWVGDVRRFVLGRIDQFLPDPPALLHSAEWVEAFNEIKPYGGTTSTVRSEEGTRIARFWSANVIRQYNQVGRDLGAGTTCSGGAYPGDGRCRRRRCADVRPVRQVPLPVLAAGHRDRSLCRHRRRLRPVPGFDDGDPSTVEETGWRPLLTTPNHPEYPAAHGVITSAMAEVFHTFLGTNQIDLDIHGFDPGGPPGNLDDVRHYDMPNDLREEIIEARIWAGLHYRFSSHPGVVLGRNVANYDLRHAFRPVR